MAKMFWLRAAVVGLSAGLVTSSASLAQGVPAEVPPASYSGDQYVDSRGCVFVRVGYGVTTEWVPRVGRDRQPVCGFQPSGTGGAPAPDLASNDTVVIIGEPAAPAPSPEPTPDPVAAAAAPAAPAPQVRIVTTPAPVIGTSPTGASGCPSLPAAHQPYFRGADVRCGPQAVHPGVSPQSGLGSGAGVAAGAATGTPRSFVLSAPPPGYELAWDDGRLNPYRGLGTAAGEAQMLQAWTNTVPRRAAPVTIPTGAHPQPSHALRGSGTAAIVVSGSSRAPAVGEEDRAPRARVPSAGDTPQAAPAANEVRVGAGDRHVLAGTYPGQPEAAAAYNRLAGLGLPARIGQIRRQGQTLFVVMAGPYDDPQSLGRALLQARNSGFSGAVTRN